MALYFILRIGGFLTAFVGWLLYQLGYKRKPFIEVKNDAFAIIFFLGVWALIVYAMRD